MRMRTPHALPRCVAAFVLAASVLSGAASAQEVVPIEAPALHGAWLVPADPAHAADPPRTTAWLVVMAGERDNTGLQGLPHYAEHLVWESAILGRSAPGDGPDSNARTTLWATTYFLDGPDTELDATLGTLARAFEPIGLRRDFMREEVGVVQREYDLRVRESADVAAWRALDAVQHEGQWAARSVIGTPEMIARLTPQAAKAWHARTHRPGNAVLVVHGAHAPDALAAAVAEAFGDAPSGAPIEAPGYATGPRADEVLERVEPRLDAPEILHSRVARVPAPLSGYAALRPVRHLLYRTLDSTRPGGLAGPLRYDEFVAASFDTGLSVVDDDHLEFWFEGRPDRDVTNAELLAALRSTLADVARAGVPDATLERVRAVVLDEIDAAERPDEYVLEDVFDALEQRATPESLGAYRARVAAVTVEDVNALLRAIVDAARVTTVMSEPGDAP